MLAVIAGFGGVVLLSVNHRKQKVAEGDHRLALRNEEREKSKLLNERFAAAAEQLAHESDQVRLAGVYALAGLADDWDEGRQKCVELLISYLRLAEAGESEVVDTIFRMFRERLTGHSPWCDVDYDFTGMTLVDMDFSGFTFYGTVTLDHVTFSGEETSFAGAHLRGGLRCHSTEFTATETSFRGATFGGEAEFRHATFSSALVLDAATVTGAARFEDCLFERPVSGENLLVLRGKLRFERCRFRNATVRLPYSQIGSWGDFRTWHEKLLGTGEEPRLGSLWFAGCELVDSSLELDDVYLVELGRVVVTDLTLRGGRLRVRPAEARHPSLVVRRLDIQDSEVDVPERFWLGRAANGTPQSSERDGHRGVGQ